MTGGRQRSRVAVAAAGLVVALATWAVAARAVEAADDLAQRLVLVGVVLADPDEPIAVIADRRTREEALYHAGDTVQGAVVVAVTADRAVLRTGGDDVELRLAITPRPSSGPAAGAGRPRPGLRLPRSPFRR
jgi:hypothetical protein